MKKEKTVKQEKTDLGGDDKNGLDITDFKDVTKDNNADEIINRINESKKENQKATGYQEKKKLKKEAELKNKVMYSMVFKTFITSLFNNIIGARDDKWKLDENEIEGLSTALEQVADKYAPNLFSKYGEEINLGFWLSVIIAKRMSIKNTVITPDDTIII